MLNQRLAGRCLETALEASFGNTGLLNNAADRIAFPESRCEPLLAVADNRIRMRIGAHQARIGRLPFIVRLQEIGLGDLHRLAGAAML